MSMKASPVFHVNTIKKLHFGLSFKKETLMRGRLAARAQVIKKLVLQTFPSIKSNYMLCDSSKIKVVIIGKLL